MGEVASFEHVAVIRPLPKNGDMAKEHRVPEAKQLPRAWTRGGTETDSL